LRILITNNTLSGRAGSELYVRDIATGLLKRGHTPIAFSTILGGVAREIRALTIPVIDNLDALATPPDIIHGQHHLETMMAMLRFPDTPAVYFCHGWLPWEETAPHFPRILRYIAVDHTCRDRLVFEDGIPEDRIRVVLNFADLERFRPRGPLPSQPARALLFSNDANEQTLRVVREACQHRGIALDVMGVGSGKACAEPESVLGGYDLVFAKARSAIEAMAVGAAVVLCGTSAVGKMVTTHELDRLRLLNFGIRSLEEPLSVAAVEREICRYDARDATRVAERIRSMAGRDAVVEDMLALYQEVIDEFKRAERDTESELRAASAYLKWLAPRLKENERVKGERDWIQREHDRLGSRLSACEEQANTLQEIGAHQIIEGERTADALTRELADKQEQLNRITGTLGWRLLSFYGPIKYRFVLPAYRRLQNLRRGQDP
jgi:hypothetical protein